MQPSLHPSDLVLGYVGSLEAAGLYGLLLLSSPGLDETVAEFVARAPSRYEVLDGERFPRGDLGPGGSSRGESVDSVSDNPDSESLARSASVVIGRTVHDHLPRPGVLPRDLAIRLGYPDPDATPVTRIVVGSDPAFELDNREPVPGAIDDLPDGKTVVAAVLQFGRSPEWVACGPVLVWDEVELPIALPDYGLGTAGNLARSCLGRLLASNLSLGPLADAEADRMRGDLYAMHAPKKALDARVPAVVVPEFLAVCEAARRLTPTMPEPRLVKTALDAERYAAEVMRAIGFRDAHVTPGGADGGIDVVSERGVAQVKMEGLPTGRPAVQALVGAALVEGRMPLFFSLAGFSNQAQEWAARAGVAAFEFAFDGGITPRTELAERLMTLGLDQLTTSPPSD